MKVNPEAIEFLKTFSEDVSIFMFNYLKYKKEVVETGLTGQETYRNYLIKATPFIEKIKAEVLFKGKPQAMILGPLDEELWDEVLIVKYNNKNEFFKLMSMPDYPFDLRASALKDSRLIVST